MWMGILRWFDRTDRVACGDSICSSGLAMSFRIPVVRLFRWLIVNV